MIPMVDLQHQYHQLKADIDQAVLGVLERTQFILGPNVTSFEQEVAHYLDVPYAVSCASGTDALQLALLASGIGPGDEVITTAFTFIATAEAICQVGATPVFVDIDPRTFTIVPALIEQAITPATRAVIPVHLFGQPADMAAISEVCARHRLIVIEDCAQSFGATTQGKMTGAIGAFGCFSFFPSKNLGCCGDGGLVTCATAEAAEALRALRNHGSKERYHHDRIGLNSRLDELQAAILRVKLAHVERFNQERRRVAQRYAAGLKDLVQLPFEDGKGLHVYHQYTLLSEHRDTIMTALNNHQIASAIYYPIPLHRQEVFRKQYSGQSLPVAESVAARCLSLPIYPELTDQQVDRVVAVVREAVTC
ncbi:MAG: DegT/DnrJ/EryC1/StrS family aminotransferase [Geobacter sp.]